MTASPALRQPSVATRRPRTCFIAAPAGLDVGPLTTELSNHGIAMPDAAPFLTGSFDWQTLTRSIKDVDIVVAVISSSSPDPNVLVGLGIALGADRPLLLLIDPKADLPWALRGTYYVRATPADIDAIRFHLGVFLSRLEEPSEEQVPQPLHRSRRPGHDALAHANDKISAWKENGGQPSELDLVSVLAELFTDAGYITVSGDNEGVIAATESTPDLAIWMDDIQDWGGNPLLVEVRSCAVVEQDSVRQLQEYVAQAQSYLGLIVHWNDEHPHEVPTFVATSWPLIAKMSVRDVVESLRHGTFAADLLHLRNRALHFGS